ncbi:MAG: hypothetical protein JNM78_05200 [Cyclobacteriaceae bacterium]|nr:hypothetical protein [Cyclobacteriaceae bacterium]
MTMLCSGLGLIAGGLRVAGNSTGIDGFGAWIEHLGDSVSTDNYQIGLMPFLRVAYLIDNRFSLGLEGGPKLGYYLTSSELKSGWEASAFQGVILVISYKF